MKHKKDWFFAIIIIILVTLLFFQYQSKPDVDDVVANSIADALVGVKDEADIQKDATQQAIDEAVNKAILGESITSKEETNTNAPNVDDKTNSTQTEAPSIADTIKDTLNNVNQTPDSTSSVKIVEIESSNRLIIEQDGKQIKIRLIGVHANGSRDGLMSLITNVDNLIIETDTKKNEGDYRLVYLWDGDPMDNGQNMINLQMVEQEFAYSTYDFVHPGVIETPNIKYQQLFIDAIKNS